MYELIKLTERDHYFDCPAKIGLVMTAEKEGILIDSGSDKEAAKKVLRTLQKNGITLKAVFNTHSHADHIGGNHFLQEKTGCPVYANGLECVFTNAPELEPMGLYGGMPFKELKHKFLLAQPSEATPLTPDALPEGIQLLRLPGHSFDMVGFLTADGTAYIADSVSSPETLAKYGIGYLWDAQASLDTLEALKSIEAARFVPSHAPVTEDIRELADLNSRAIRSVCDKILSLCEKPSRFEDILQTVFNDYSLTASPQQYALIGSTLRSYLSSLYGAGRLCYEFADNAMLWKAV